MPHLEAPERFLEAVGAFLARRVERGGSAPGGRASHRRRRRRGTRATGPGPRLGDGHGPTHHLLVCSACGATTPAGTGSARGAARGTRWSRSALPRRAGPRRGAAGARAPPGGRCRCARSRRARAAPAHGDRRARPRPRRRPRARVARPARRLARGSASRRSRAWRSATSRPPGGARSTSRARSRRRRSACAPSAWARRALEVPVLAETDLDAVLATIEAERPEACVDRLGADAARRRRSSRRPARSGRCARWPTRITSVAKRRAPPCCSSATSRRRAPLAGPRVLEHLVDCVLQFEGERERTYRTLRALKNRFGSTNEVGVFEMREGGLVEVLDASARFVGEATRAPGSVVLAAMEGSRPLLVEVQALVSPCELVPPRRVCTGLDRNRLALVLAVLGAPRGRRRRAPATSSSTSSAACASTSRGPTWRSRSRWRAPRAACADRARAAGLLRRGRADRRAALGRPPRPPRRGGRQVRAAAGRLARPARPTLRACRAARAAAQPQAA